MIVDENRVIHGLELRFWIRGSDSVDEEDSVKL